MKRKWFRKPENEIEMPVVVEQRRRRIVTAQQRAVISGRMKKYNMERRNKWI